MVPEPEVTGGDHVPEVVCAITMVFVPASDMKPLVIQPDELAYLFTPIVVFTAALLMTICLAVSVGLEIRLFSMIAPVAFSMPIGTTAAAAFCEIELPVISGVVTTDTEPAMSIKLVTVVLAFSSSLNAMTGDVPPPQYTNPMPPDITL